MSLWDRVKSSDAAVLIKVYVDPLKEIPASVVVSSDKKAGESWTFPVVIIHENSVGKGPPEEDPIPDDGNPHPRPDEDHHHPNKNLIIGPFLDVHNANHDEGEQHNNQNHNAAQDDMEEVEPGWGHSAMPIEEQEIDQELHAEEFLELNDLLAPLIEENILQELGHLDDESGLALSLAIPSLFASSAESINNGPHLNDLANLKAPLDLNFPLPDLNLAAVGPLDEEADGFPLVADMVAPEAVFDQPVLLTENPVLQQAIIPIVVADPVALLEEIVAPASSTAAVPLDNLLQPDTAIIQNNQALLSDSVPVQIDFSSVAIDSQNEAVVTAPLQSDNLATGLLCAQTSSPGAAQESLDIQAVNHVQQQVVLSLHNPSALHKISIPEPSTAEIPDVTPPM